MLERFFQWPRVENRKPFYIVVALLVFCGMTAVALAMGLAPLGTKTQEAGAKVIAYGGGFLALLFLVVRSEQLKTGQNTAVVVAEETKKATEEAAKALPEETAALTLQKINGGLAREAKKEVGKALAASPFPTTHEELEAFVRSVQSVECEQMIDRALDRAIERGWKAPEKQGE